MENIAPYNENEFISVFKTTEVYKKLRCDYTDDKLVWHKFFHLGNTIKSITEERSSVLRTGGYSTPRAYKEEFSASIFYYLLPLLEKNPKKIYDLGCGKNMFKPYLPNIIGIGAEYMLENNNFINGYNRLKDESWPIITCLNDFKKLSTKIKKECVMVHKLDLRLPLSGLADFYGDEHGLVNDKYINDHQKYFESVFAICSLHFRPLSDFKKIVLYFASMIANTGRGFLSLNLQRLIERSSTDFLTAQFGTTTPTTMQYDNWLRKELSTTKLNFLILDVDLTLLDEAIDGNIRLVIEK